MELEENKHIFIPIDNESEERDDKDFCKICGKNFRDTNVHKKINEI